MPDDLTAAEKRKFGPVFAKLDDAKKSLEDAAKLLEGKGYRERAHKVRGVAQSADAQKYLLTQDPKPARKARKSARTG